jgi:ABC-type branched-subunit amino acid transport system substrate-binding protein
MRGNRLVLVTVVVALGLASCVSPADNTDEVDRPEYVRLYGTDGTMQDPFGDGLADRTVLRGMKGTAPLNPLPSEFANRLRELDPSLESFVFAGETYDAVVISALAAELAGTPDPAVVRTYINSVTVGGTECSVVAECLELARDGEQLAYRGVSLRRGGFTDRGEPSSGSYATMHFGHDGTIDEDKTEFVGAGDPSAISEAPEPEPGPRPDGPLFNREPLRLGGLLPETGELSFAYPPLIAGALLAVEEINDVGGVFDVDVEWLDGDDGTDPEVARATLASHAEEGVHIIIGAAASGVTEAVLPDAVAAGLIMFSPSNTAVELSAIEDDGYYFRTAPSDDLQGAALADIMLRDGTQRVVIVARDDAYGRGLQGNAQDALVRFGVPAGDIRLLSYNLPEEEGAPLPGLERLVDEIAAAEPDGVLVIGFSEAAQLIQRMVDVGLLAPPEA